MKISRIIEKLKESAYGCTYIGPADADVYAVDQAGRSTHFTAGILYINSTDAYQYAHIYESMCILTVEPYNVAKVTDMVQQMLLNDAKLMRDALSLQHSLAGGDTVDNVTTLLSNMFENPVMLMSMDAAPLALSGYQAQDINLLANIQADQMMRYSAERKFTLLEKGSTGNPLQRRLIFTRIHGENGGMYMVVAEQENSFDATDVQQRMSIVSDVFASVKWQHGEMSAQASMRSILFKLLQNKPASPVDVKRQLEALGWKFYEKYYVLSIYRKLQNSTGSLVKELETIIGEPVYEFGDYYVSILHSDWKTELFALFGRNFPELTAFIKKTNMYASLSYGFFDITDAAQAMRQTVRVIEIIRKYKWSQRINGYGDMVISHLIDTALMHGEITLDSICHPITLKIREYDEKNDTDLLDVLATYIFSGLSVKVAAEYLHMHINTVYQRIHKLEEDFGIDFTDRRVVTMLHISIIAMAYRGDYPSEKYL